MLGRPDEGVFDEVCRAPLAALGLTERVHFLGYREAQAYWDVLLAWDAFLFLVPGSDVTCRALREAMASGLPAVCPQDRALTEFVDDRHSGFVCRDEPEGLASALTTLAEDQDLRRQMGQHAARAAREGASASELGPELLALYQDLNAGPSA